MWPIKRKAVYTLVHFHKFIYYLDQIDPPCIFFKTTYLILVSLQAVAGSKNFCFRQLIFIGYCLIRRTLDYCACSLSCSQPEYSVCGPGEKQKGESTGIRHKYQGIRSKLDLKKISNGLSRVSQSHPFPSTLTTKG